MVDQLAGKAAVLYALDTDRERLVQTRRRNNGVGAPDGFVGCFLNKGEVLARFVFNAVAFFETKSFEVFSFLLDMRDDYWFV